jgi:hypothetical protein
MLSFLIGGVVFMICIFIVTVLVLTIVDILERK